MNKKINKKMFISFGVLFCILICGATLLGCSMQNPDYTNYVSSTYSPSNVEVFVDDLNETSIKLPENRDIKILQLTDIHIGNGPLTTKKDKKAIQAVCSLIEYTKPDLIVLTGDMVFPVTIMTGTNDNLNALKVLARVIEKYKTPWTLCMGNHDAEETAKYSKSELCDYLESDELEYCLFNRGPSRLDGMGNHLINVYNSDHSINSTLFFFDNGMYNGNLQLTGYQEISESQVEWYSNKIETFIEKFGKTIPSYVFYHVPGKEYENAWEEYRSGNEDVELIYGWANESNEKVSSSVELGSFFETAVNLGSTKAIFCGHNHLNDFSLIYKGIRLTFGKSIDYTAYAFQGIADKTEQRGGTVLVLKTNSSFEIYPIKLTDIA